MAPEQGVHGLKGSSVEQRTRSDWQSGYARRLMVSDLIVVTAVVFGTQAAWLGISHAGITGIGLLDYTGLSALLVVAWMAALAMYDTRSPRVVGYGSGEYRAIVNGALRLFGLFAIASYLLQAEISRGYVLISFPLGVIVLIFSRWLWRRWLLRRRKGGDMVSRVLLVGDTKANLRILAELSRQPEAGYVVVGVCTASPKTSDTLGPTKVPVLGGLDDLAHALEETKADTVLVSSESGLAAERVRELSWQLEAGQQHLIMAPNLTDIGGPRIHMRPVAGLPLMHVETPRYTGPQVVAKRAFDMLGSGLLILLLSPVLITIAILVKTTSRGPVLYGQERIGMNGVPFMMMKFRSMIVDADAQLESLLAAQGRSDSPLFKVENDPRITTVGRILRKYSLDELPQLFNVFLGSMSLVGPRPQREGEVALYDDAAQRRLIVKPGMSGLWQVSGRSSLSWEDAIRLDLYYVENWSLTGDLNILFRTFKAVFAPGETAH
ncbi:exopolysaccharide biosynthesis polyprenyl glycosylphosphotransferase [Microbacterium resistens]|uniref:Exopolysaccharide biosynthesis polyprenyl glycosylphosphotransferase n=1 Tax=Microbacterium resistens TaxID=156977 RepID=A0ABU1SEA4_9MICO|nr:sugar transferase [Microbacterium resistens]MDR6867248.1 exopolysaccharide biosynthesis polyprenyl glycosylphosphotransferase [Microbacterium resistens]